ncbi:phage/plasmid primase, P4 family [Gemmatimonadota bacterium]
MRDDLRAELHRVLENNTDVGNGRRLVRLHGHQLKYCERLGGWFVWDGKRWARDERKVVQAYAKDTAKTIYEEALCLKDSTDRKGMVKWAISTEADARIKAMVNQACSEPEIITVPSDFDSDPWAFNVRNGTLDLRTGTLHQHDRDSLLTKLADVAFDADATAPTWERFLAEVLTAPVASYLQRAVGLSMIGEVREHTLLFLYGSGANGKTTLLRALQELFGDYGQQADPELLLMRRGEAHPTGVADLVASRLVVTTEVQDGRRLAESQVKSLTGGDRIKARFMHRDFFEFDPTWTIWMAANHKPVVKGTDEGIWRRIRLIPFNVTIATQDQDPDLPAKLKDELPGILNWAIAGCLEYQRDGLQAPADVLAATQQYRAQSDVVGLFLEEHTDTGPDLWVESTDLFKNYVEWCHETGERPLNQRRFGQDMTERGYERGKSPDRKSRRVTYLGIALQNGRVKGSETIRTDFSYEPTYEKSEPILSQGFTTNKHGGFLESPAEGDDAEYASAEREGMQLETQELQG